MRLNTIKPAPGAKQSPKRVGRGIGSGLGKTCGRGHKGQHARAGGYHKLGFEGGQMPIQRRLPKFGFTSIKGLYTAEVRLHELSKVADGPIDLAALKAANLISKSIEHVKIILSGKLEKAVVITNSVKLTAGARKAIEAAGGRVEE